ncbi:MAG TPA: phosphoglucosamine mutase [Firmicutes bacterium]|nr:phosphoglucosamine mutase [Bacillota bacterium]
MGRLFGTDGARGIANTELTCELAMAIGRAAATVLTRHTSHRPKIVIGWDTRISSQMLQSALSAGICSVGADALLLGMVPTPAVAYLVGRYGADAGVMISASHNPVEFNGIKLFDRRGYKLPDSIEEEIETLILDMPETVELKEGISLGRILNSQTAAADYITHLTDTVQGDLCGMKIAVDCANGSASATAAELFKKLGAEIVLLHAEPDGTNINQACGSTHMESLMQYVREHSCDAGVAFDGDADRCLAVDEKGNLVDGDQIMAIFAHCLQKQGLLAKDTLVATVMSNIGLFKFAEENGIHIVKTKVGDRYVLEEMLAFGYILGGEQSGHIIFGNYASTGDGQLSAIQLLSILKNSGLRFSELASMMTVYPQYMENVRVCNEKKQDWDNDPEIRKAIASAEQMLGENGRILVRASGTEPLIRVMAEGKELGQITLLVQDIVRTVQKRLC